MNQRHWLKEHIKCNEMKTATIPKIAMLTGRKGWKPSRKLKWLNGAMRPLWTFALFGVLAVCCFWIQYQHDFHRHEFNLWFRERDLIPPASTIGMLLLGGSLLVFRAAALNGRKVYAFTLLYLLGIPLLWVLYATVGETFFNARNPVPQWLVNTMNFSYRWFLSLPFLVLLVHEVVLALLIHRHNRSQRTFRQAVTDHMQRLLKELGSGWTAQSWQHAEQVLFTSPSNRQHLVVFFPEPLNIQRAVGNPQHADGRPLNIPYIKDHHTFTRRFDLPLVYYFPFSSGDWPMVVQQVLDGTVYLQRGSPADLAKQLLTWEEEETLRDQAKQRIHDEHLRQEQEKEAARKHGEDLEKQAIADLEKHLPDNWSMVTGQLLRHKKLDVDVRIKLPGGQMVVIDVKSVRMPLKSDQGEIHKMSGESLYGAGSKLAQQSLAWGGAPAILWQPAADPYPVFEHRHALGVAGKTQEVKVLVVPGGPERLIEEIRKRLL